MNSPPGRHDEDASVISDSLARPESFGELYHRHAAVIHRYAARRLGEDAAEDITAETFLAAFRARGRYDVSRADARPWLYGIAANLIGKQRRTEVRALRALARTGRDPVADSWTDGTTAWTSRPMVPLTSSTTIPPSSAGWMFPTN
ncbi:sigma factor, partial [Streptomyces sp. NPDC052127]|uniref:RNA polymerase sigma factor n=1 Tax=Streptomyces sp. NPDC052127 TaxID=3155679 RepID=UPI00343849B0